MQANAPLQSKSIIVTTYESARGWHTDRLSNYRHYQSVDLPPFSLFHTARTAHHCRIITSSGAKFDPVSLSSLSPSFAIKYDRASSSSKWLPSFVDLHQPGRPLSIHWHYFACFDAPVWKQFNIEFIAWGRPTNIIVYLFSTSLCKATHISLRQL